MRTNAEHHQPLPQLDIGPDGTATVAGEQFRRDEVEDARRFLTNNALPLVPTWLAPTLVVRKRLLG